jgi:cyclohexyl-isocyanide hydratase
MTAPFRIGFLLFPRLTQLDLTGPWEILARLPGAEPHLLWKSLDPVRADTGLSILPTDTLAACPALDMLCVPGGPGVNALIEDGEVLDFLRRRAPEARYVTSVCTGALVLGAAGLLRGKRATTHWAVLDLLAAFGAEPVPERVVVDGPLVTGGGITAGIDFGLHIAAAEAGRETAERIQLQVEYAPAPPFASGSPATADPALVEQARHAGAALQRERERLVEKAAAALAES